MAKWNRRQFLSGLLATVGVEAAVEAEARLLPPPAQNALASSTLPARDLGAPAPPVVPSVSAAPAVDGSDHALRELLPEGLRFLTLAGLPAITAVIAEGISVNVTLIFSVERHRGVMDAYLAGLEAAAEAGHDLARIHSVASFFVSRVDTEIDARLDKIGTPGALALRGKAGLANARLAYAAYQEVFEGGERFEALTSKGARVQRPLWASTGVKNPDYPDTLYVTELVAANTVNTMPEKTLEAVADHGTITGDTITGTAEASQGVFDELDAAGIDLVDVFKVLEDEGVDKFEKSWQELIDATRDQLDTAGK